MNASRSGVDVAADELLAAVALLDHEPGALEHGDVLLHGGEAHRVAAGERRHRVLLRHRADDDVAAGGVGERMEDAIGAIGAAGKSTTIWL